MAFELLGGDIAEEFHGVTAFDERQAFGQEALEFDGANFRAVLFLLAALLSVLVVVEFALHTVGGSMEEIDGRPQEVRDVRFEARVRECHDQRVEDVSNGTGDRIDLGQRPWVGLVLEGTVTMELQLRKGMADG